MTVHNDPTTTTEHDLVVHDGTLVRWRPADGGAFTGGLVREGLVWSLAGVPGVDGDVLAACLAVRDHGLDFLAEQVTGASADAPVPLEDVEFGSPLTRPDKILCLGLNYADHASEAGFEPPEYPIVFSKFRNSLVGPRDPIVLPRTSTQVDFEGELAVIIGRRAKYVDRADALAHVGAYAVCNDVSARDLQLRTSQWTQGKALDTFAPLGPGLVPAELVGDPQDLLVTTTVSGQVMQRDSTSLMIFDIAETVAYLSSVMTLEPGDVIATGTPAGVGLKQDPPRFLADGDVVEVAIEGIGTIRNPVVAEPRDDDSAGGPPDAP
ncbi:MAG TPA: fumarylacetoacetate hydrolase family protein [Nitriliruptoraceae bacterium]|nr:fumarylacetoacetate hydrolase family protein [Nitriliruptoraceae bacterium]